MLTFEAVLQEVKQHLATQAEPIVDVGCAEGQLLQLLQRQGYQNLTGIGYEIQVPEAAQAISQVDLSQPNWSSLLPEQQFACVIATDVIEHLVNPYNFLTELRKIISKHGKLILTFPNVHNLRSILLYSFQGRFSGFFGRNLSQDGPLFDQHIFIPNLHLLSYFLKQNRFIQERLVYIHGSGQLFSQTILLVARPV